MGGVSVGSIGVADDVALVSPSPHALQSFLNLSQSLTSARKMVNVKEKTKLLLFHPPRDKSASYWQETSPLTMAGAALPLSLQAEHVGVLRCPNYCKNSWTHKVSLLSDLLWHGKKSPW